MNGDVFPDGIAVPDLKAGDFTLVFLVLWVLANGGKLEDPIESADKGRSLDDHVRPNHRSGADFNLRPDHGKGANADVRGESRRGVNQGRGMDQALSSAAAHMISALATNSPATSARHSKAQILRLWRT